MAYQRILEERSFVEIAVELDCSLKFLYHHFGMQQECARLEPVRSPLRLSPSEREEISRGLQAGASFRALSAQL